MTVFIIILLKYIAYLMKYILSATYCSDNDAMRCTGVSEFELAVQRQFLPRDAMHCISTAYAVIATFIHPSVCLSVSLSVMFIKSVKLSNHILKIFSPLGSQTILVFPY